jgi:very-short-patch-repair endonuclease
MRESPAVRALAASQHGLITMKQANVLGIKRKSVEHRLERGWWQTVERGVYQLSNGEISTKARVMAAVLLIGRGAVVTHKAAGWLHELDDVEPDFLVIAVPSDRRVRSRERIRVQARCDVEATIVDNIPVTTGADTVIDLSQSRDFDGAIGLAARAVQRRTTTADQLIARIHARPGVRWRDQLLMALGDVSDGAESIFEIRFLRDVVRRHGLPEPTLQRPDQGPSGGIRRDFDWEEYRVVAETDGELGHTGEGMRRDRARDRQAARTGRVTLRCVWVEVVHQPCDLALDVGLTLRDRGWRGELVPCSPECPLGAPIRNVNPL